MNETFAVQLVQFSDEKIIYRQSLIDKLLWGETKEFFDVKEDGEMGNSFKKLVFS